MPDDGLRLKHIRVDVERSLALLSVGKSNNCFYPCLSGSLELRPARRTAGPRVCFNKGESQMMDQTVLGNDGHSKTLRRFFDETTMEQSVNAALRDPVTQSVSVKKVGRNDKCPCGSGEKFKKCCLWKVNAGVEIVT